MSARLLRGIGANVYGQAVTVAVQLGTVPVLLRAWGDHAFGSWLTICAWTSMLSLADGGMMVAAGSAATMALARGDAATALDLFRKLFGLVAAIGVGLGAVVAAIAIWLPAALFDTAGQELHLRAAAASLGAAALVALPLGIVDLGFRAQGTYATGMLATSTVRLAETCAVVAAAVAGGGPASAAAALLAIRCVGAVVMGVLLRRRAPWLRAPHAGPGTVSLTSLVRPAMAAFALPAGLVVALQGATIAAGFVVSAEAVATFVAARTLTRTIVQALGLVTHALMPEVAIANGQGDSRRSAALIRLNLLAGFGLLLPGWALLVALGPAVVVRWTGGALRPDPVFFAILATAAVAHGCWLSASNLLLAVNRQADFAYHALALAGATCVLAVLLGRTLQLDGIALAGLFGELAMAALVVPPQIGAAFRAHNRLPTVAGP